jgi:hypothetical protein
MVIGIHAPKIIVGKKVKVMLIFEIVMHLRDTPCHCVMLITYTIVVAKECVQNWIQVIESSMSSHYTKKSQ